MLVIDVLLLFFLLVVIVVTVGRLRLQLLHASAANGLEVLIHGDASKRPGVWWICVLDVGLGQDSVKFPVWLRCTDHGP